MKRSSSRAAVDPVSLVVVAVIVLLAAPSSSTPGKKHFWEFWKKNPVAQVDQAAAAVDQAKRDAEAAVAPVQAKVDAQREAQLHVGQEAAVATGVAIKSAQAAVGAGKPPVKELETAATLNRTNVDAMDQALGAAAPARVRELETMVANLNAGVAAGAKALDLMQASLDRTVQEKAAALAELDRVKADGKAKVDNAERARDAAVKQEQAWALERDAIARSYEDLKFYGGLGVALILVLAAWLWWHARGAGELNHDLVAMGDWLKTQIPADRLQHVEQQIQNEWLTVRDGTAAAVQKIRGRLRL